MFIICEPRFQVDDKDDFLKINTLENEAYLRSEIIRIISDLFPPDTIVKTIGNTLYGISVFDPGNIEVQMRLLNTFNLEKNRIDIKYEEIIYNAVIELCTFMNRKQYPIDKVFSDQDIWELQDSGVELESIGLNSLSDIVLTYADLNGFNFNSLNPIDHCLFEHTLLIASQFTDTTIINTNFKYADMRNAMFNVTTMTNVEFYEADLRYADFQGSTLTDVDFSEANLLHTNFNNVTFAGNCKFDMADLRYTHFNDVQFDGNCTFTGAQFVNITSIIEKNEYPANIFAGVINTEEDEADDYGQEEGQEDGDDYGEVSAFLTANQAIFSSANVKLGEKLEYEQEYENDAVINSTSPTCYDMISGDDINIDAFLASSERSNANFIVQLPDSESYECINLNVLKRIHIKTDKNNTDYFNYVYACHSNTPYLSFTEDNYIRGQPYIRLGNYNLIVEKPEWFPAANIPMYRKFKLVKTGWKPAFVSETMLRYGEKGDADYARSEWHCSAGKMDTYKLEPLFEIRNKTPPKKTHRRKYIHIKGKKTPKNTLKKTQKNTQKNTQKKPPKKTPKKKPSKKTPKKTPKKTNA